MSGESQRTAGRIARVGALAIIGLSLAHCSNSNSAGKVDPRYGVAASPRVVEPGEPVPKGGGTYRVGKPYMVAGRVYYPEDNARYRAEGIASWYGADFHGRLTANGEVYDLQGISAAHPTMPLPSYARVTNLANGRSLVVRVNDRGPYHGNRVVDVSVQAAHLLGFHRNGTARVRVEYVGPAPIEGSDDRVLASTLRHHGPAPAPVQVASARRFTPAASPPVATYGLGASTVPPPAQPAPAVAPRAAALAVSFGPTGADGTAQFMNGRGLY